MQAHHLRRWSNIKPALRECLVLSREKAILLSAPYSCSSDGPPSSTLVQNYVLLLTYQCHQLKINFLSHIWPDSRDVLLQSRDDPQQTLTDCWYMNWPLGGAQIDMAFPSDDSHRGNHVLTPRFLHSQKKKKSLLSLISPQNCNSTMERVQSLPIWVWWEYTALVQWIRRGSWGTHLINLYFLSLIVFQQKSTVIYADIEIFFIMKTRAQSVAWIMSYFMFLISLQMQINVIVNDRRTAPEK